MIELKHVTKLYDGINGVKDINLCINSKETISLIGPNGAGKSTLIKLLCGILHEDQGEIIMKQDIRADISIRKEIGYMPDMVRLSNNITAWELLQLVSDFKFKGQEKAYIDRMVSRYHLEGQMKKRFAALSLGTQKKVALIIAMMGEPEILILDEPTTGLDTEGILTLKEDILKAKERGGCIIISGHILDFLGTVADRNIFLQRGQIVRICDSESNLDDIYREIYMS